MLTSRERLDPFVLIQSSIKSSPASLGFPKLFATEAYLLFLLSLCWHKTKRYEPTAASSHLSTVIQPLKAMKRHHQSLHLIGQSERLQSCLNVQAS